MPHRSSEVTRQPGRALLLASWRAFVVVTRRLLVAAAVLISLLGALTAAPVVVLVGAPGVGLAVALMVAAGNPGFPRTAEGRRAAWTAGSIGALLLPFASGVVLLGAAGAVVVVGLLTHGAVWVAEWLTETDDEAAATRRHLAALERALPDLPTGALVRQWRSTGDRLGADDDPCARAATAEVRALLIDELTRRDPAGVARWLSSGGDPDEHLSGEPGRAV